jgi:stringent starvation protein B
VLPRRPYLIRALYEWLVDSGEVPHLLVDVTVAGVDVPATAVKDGRTVLNVGPDAVQGLQLGNEELVFSARFQGTPRQVRIPPLAVIAIYGRDSGQGMMFGPEDDPEGTDAGADDDKQSPPTDKPTKPSLKIIK